MCDCIVLNAWCLLLAIVGSLERIHLQTIVDASHSIAVGASQEDVVAAIGEPDEKWDARSPGYSLLFGFRPRQWIYGRAINPGVIIVRGLLMPNPFAISLRLFDADKSDLVINWNASGQVTKVHRPDLEIPPR